jgi:hypothetical protein
MDAVLIARLDAKLRCYVPERVDEIWGRLRHLGARRAQLLDEAGSQVQQMRALLERAWPASLDAARQPFRWATWPGPAGSGWPVVGRVVGSSLHLLAVSALLPTRIFAVTDYLKEPKVPAD